MSVTFYVDGWHDVPMVDMPVFVKDEYPSLDRSDFLDQNGNPHYGYHLSQNGDVYRIEEVPLNDIVWPEVNKCNSNAAYGIRTLIENCSEDDFACGQMTGEQVRSLPIERTPVFLNQLIEFARERGKGIYWT